MHDLLHRILSDFASAWRFRWYAVITAWVVGLVGLGVVTWLPNVYEASARIYVDGTSVLKPLLTDRIVSPDVATQLLYVRQSLLSTEFLEVVAAEHGFVSPETSIGDRDAAIEDLRSRVVIDAVSADERRNTGLSSMFTITFRNKRSDVAVGVVRSLMDALIEDTRNANREGTDRASRFLDERIAEHEARLDKAEQALAEFQRENSNTLPGSEGGYFERIQRERESLEKTRRDLRLAQSRRERVRQQLTSESPMTLDDPTLAREPRANSIDARIRDSRAELDRLLLQYTERHPEVIAMRESLARLDAQRAEQLNALGIKDVDQQLSALGANPVYQAVQIAMNEIEVEIANLETDARDREQRLDELQALINEVPGVEAELARLNRDYNVIKDQYQALIKSRETQQLSQQASDSDQVEFRVLNPPRAAPEPVAPPRLILIAAVLGAALIGGAALSYALAQLRPVFGDATSLRMISGFPVIGTVSRIQVDPKVVLKQKFAMVGIAAATASLVLLVGGAALYEFLGPGIHSLVGGT